MQVMQLVVSDWQVAQVAWQGWHLRSSLSTKPGPQVEQELSVASR